MSARVASTAEAAAHAARNGVESRVFLGNNPRAHLGNAGANTVARSPPVLTLFGKAAVGDFAAGSGLLWGGYLAIERTNCGSRAWSSPSPGASVETERTTVGGGGISGGGARRGSSVPSPFDGIKSVGGGGQQRQWWTPNRR